jgi:sulfite reductase alpha subunit-like flavoprotein
MITTYFLFCFVLKPTPSNAESELITAAIKQQQHQLTIKVLYGTVTGKARHFAREFVAKCTAMGHSSVTLLDMKDYDPDPQLFVDAKQGNVLLVIFVSTYTDGVAPENAAWFHKCLIEMACDFRVQKDALAGLLYSVCGLGNSLYEENFNKVAVELDNAFAELHATRLAPIYLCDENTAQSRHSSLEGDVDYWQKNFFEKLQHWNPNDRKTIDKEQKSDSCCCKKQSNDDNEMSNGGCCQTATKTLNYMSNIFFMRFILGSH